MRHHTAIVRCVLVAFATGLVAGCGESTAPADTPAPSLPTARPARIEIVAGNDQAGVVATALAVPLTVRVTDSVQRALANVAVVYAVTAGNGALGTTSTTTDSAGRALALFTLGTTAGGAHRVEVRVPVANADSLAATFVATALPAAPATVAFASAPSQLTVGASAQLRVTVADVHSNVIHNTAASWSVQPAHVASVSGTGLLVALARGEAQVTATVASVSASATVRVVQPTVQPSNITFALGTPEVVFRYRIDRCDALDVPDVTTRAVRMDNGAIALYSGNAPRAYASFGATFNSLQRSCAPTLVSDDDPTAPGFNNQEWLSTVYREGNVYHAIVHNEYHDPVHPNCKPGDTSPANPCWYNGLTYAASTDGRTFQQPPVPQHMLAGPPQRWNADGARAPGPYGYFTPSNIVRRDDGYYYAMFFTIPDRDNQVNRGSCVMRTNTLHDPASWRAWNGTAYALPMPSPYASTATGTACTIVAPFGIDGSLTWNSAIGRYLFVGATGVSINGLVKCGFVYALSDDLIRWSEPGLIKESPTPFPPCANGPNTGREYYPAVIDHADTTINFERSGSTFHIYYMRYNNNALDRDLLRVPVSLTIR